MQEEEIMSNVINIRKVDVDDANTLAYYNAGFSKVMLWVFKENYMARKFYENNGFVLTEKTKVFNDAIEVMYCKYL